MATAIKIALCIFLLIGVALAAFGLLELRGTAKFVSSSSGKASARFAGYYRSFHRTPSGLSLQGSGGISIASFAEFEYTAPGGGMETVREPKVHVFETYRAGDTVEILLFPDAKPRMVGFYSLYFRDLLILILGLGFILLAGSFWRFALPALLETVTRSGPMQTSGVAVPSLADDFSEFLDRKIVGPITGRKILIGAGAFFGITLVVILGAVIAPYVTSFRFGASGRLLDALQENRFDDARQLIEKGAGIGVVDDIGQTPLLITLDAGQWELARMLIKAGVDVNVRAETNMTPMRLAAAAGEMETVKLLLSKGASPDLPDDKVPPFYYAMVNGHDEVARLLIESGADLHRSYRIGEVRTGTAGDLAVLAEKQEMIALIRQRGGTFTDPATESGK